MFRALMCPSLGAHDYVVDYIRMPGSIYIYIYIYIYICIYIYIQLWCFASVEPLLGEHSVEIFVPPAKYSSPIYFYIGTDDTLR